jgi:hypothetical protein
MTKPIRGAVQRTANAFDNMITDRVTLAGGPAGTALADVPTAILEVIVQNSPNSANVVQVGNATGQFVELTAGQSITIPINDLSLVYVSSPAGAATVNWIAMT